MNHLVMKLALIEITYYQGKVLSLGQRELRALKVENFAAARLYEEKINEYRGKIASLETKLGRKAEIE